MTKRYFIAPFLFGLFLWAGCRGMISEKPPIHPNLNMDFQERFEAQEANSMFADGRAMRPMVPGAIARGFLREDTPFYEGREADGSFVLQSPVALTMAIVERGQSRYNINCAPCHGEAGDGQGLITTGGYGFVPAPTYHSDRMRGLADGYLYHVITNGFSTMSGYGYQISVEDRWAIVAYLRALQRSQHAQAGDVPDDVLQNLPGSAQ